MKKIFALMLFIILITSFGFAQTECPTVNPNTQPIPAFNTLDTNSIRHQNVCQTVSNYNGGSPLMLPNIGILAFQVPNQTPTGTTNFAVTKLTGAPSTALIAAVTDANTATPIGITINGGGTTGNATVAFAGIVPCTFDNATTAGDFVGISTGTAGDCTDLGTTQPTNGHQVIGRVIVTNASTGQVNLMILDGLVIAGGIAIPKPVFLTGGAYTNATTSFTSVPGLAISVGPNLSYKMTCHIFWQGSAGTTGPKYQFTGPAAPTRVEFGVFSNITSSTYTTGTVAAFSSPFANAGAITTATDFEDRIDISILNGANSGTAQLQAAANGAGTLTIQTTSYCE